MAIVRYKKNTRLTYYKAKDVVIDVPLSEYHLAASLATISAHSQDKEGKTWWGITNNIIAHFDASKFEPLVFCKRCGWIENGGHRLAVASKLNLKVDVEIREHCQYPRSLFGFRKGWTPPWAINTRIPVSTSIADLNSRLGLIHVSVLEGVKVEVTFNTQAELDNFLAQCTWRDLWWLEFRILKEKNDG